MPLVVAALAVDCVRGLVPVVQALFVGFLLSSLSQLGVVRVGACVLLPWHKQHVAAFTGLGLVRPKVQVCSRSTQAGTKAAIEMYRVD